MARSAHPRAVRDRQSRYFWACKRFAVRLLGVIVGVFCLSVFVLPREVFTVPFEPEPGVLYMHLPPETVPIEIFGIHIEDPLHESFIGYLIETQHFFEAVVGVGYVELLVVVFAVGAVLELFDRTDVLVAVRQW